MEVSSQSWEQHGKLRSQSLLWLHEARQQVFPQGRTMYFYDGSMQHFGAVDGLHCYWFQKSCLLQVEQSLLEEQLRQVNAEKNALMAHSSVDVRLSILLAVFTIIFWGSYAATAVAKAVF